VFDDIGYNFEPSEIMAAYGLVQLDKLEEFNKRRQHNFAMLDDVVAKYPDKVIRPRTTEGADTTWMRYPFVLAEGIDRTAVQERFLERGIATRMVWTGNILRQPGFAGIEHRAPKDGFPNADTVMDRATTLPVHHALTSDDVGYLCEMTDEVLRDL
jgi:CDP-6-deoxy-D-xylo-4-hexulose-3-dehydrase